MHTSFYYESFRFFLYKLGSTEVYIVTNYQHSWILNEIKLNFAPDWTFFMLIILLLSIYVLQTSLALGSFNSRNYINLTQEEFELRTTSTCQKLVHVQNRIYQNCNYFYGDNETLYMFINLVLNQKMQIEQFSYNEHEHH